MRLRLAPLNPTIGDIAGNAGLIDRAIDAARAARIDLLVLPELCICGYPPKDLLLQEGFVEACEAGVRRLAGLSRGVTTIVGSPWPADAGRDGAGAGTRAHNSLLALRDGRIIARYDKRLLPTYDVFDEDRYFAPGDSAVVIEVAGARVGLTICEDLWRGADAGALARYARRADPMDDVVRAGARIVVNASASPFVLGKGPVQRRILTEHVRAHAVPLVAVNQHGANDDLIFDGRAAAYVPDAGHPSGARLVSLAPGFSGGCADLDLAHDPSAWAAIPAVADPLDGPDDDADLWKALTLGVRDYCGKTGFSQVVIGLSGGVDSAVVCCIAAGALGPANVRAVSMPSRYSSVGSRDDAAALAAALGVALHTAPIEPAHAALEASLAEPLGGAGTAAPGDVTWENVQSRVRGLILMAFANRAGALVLTTGNKSELGVGYCTLYGDMNGGLAVVADVTKAGVYALARWINANAAAIGLSGAKDGPIPQATLTKPPSAELRPDQTDQDTLPPYDVVDEVVERYVERRQSAATIARESGLDASLVARIIRMIDTSEFKRKQAAIGLKVTGVAFGAGRRWPIAQRWRP